MLVTSSGDSSVLDTANGDVYIRRTALDYMRFLHLRGMKPIEIHQQLSETCKDVKNVRSWVRQFKEGRTSYENKPKEPWPRTI